MSFWKGVQDKAVIGRLEEEAIHAAALDELESGSRRKGLWAKAIIEADGDPARTQAAYLRLVVAALKDELYMAGRLQDTLELGDERRLIESSAITSNITPSSSNAVRRCAQEVLENRGEFHTCATLIAHAGGSVEAKGILFGIHYIIRINGNAHRIDRIEDLLVWVNSNLPVSRWASGQS